MGPPRCPSWRQRQECSWLSAGTPEHPAVPNAMIEHMFGDNPSGAGNQQERPGIEQWIVGFVDGEGCFSLPIHRNRSMRIGWMVQPSFAVVQGERSAHVLHLIRDQFGCGKVYLNRRRDNHREDLLVYGVFNQHELRTRIVPFFEANPLRTAKAG